MLGIGPTSDLDTLRKAYHQKAKTCHPDQFQDRQQQEEANARMVRLNRAYEEAVRLVSARAYNPYHDAISCDDAVKMALRLIDQEAPERAIRALMRATQRDAAWFGAQGRALMQLDQFATAEESFRRALSMDPGNASYRRWAFDAYAENKRSHTLKGRLKQMMSGE